MKIDGSKFDEEAVGILMVAIEEAKNRGYRLVRTEHVLYAILMDEACDAYMSLATLIGLDKIRELKRRVLSKLYEPSKQKGSEDISFTENLKLVVFEYASEVAAKKNGGKIGTWDLLSGLMVLQAGNLARELLEEAGVPCSGMWKDRYIEKSELVKS